MSITVTKYACFMKKKNFIDKAAEEKADNYLGH
jgi:hypothetical protein